MEQCLIPLLQTFAMWIKPFNIQTTLLYRHLAPNTSPRGGERQDDVAGRKEEESASNKKAEVNKEDDETKTRYWVYLYRV